MDCDGWCEILGISIDLGPYYVLIVVKWNRTILVCLVFTELFLNLWFFKLFHEFWGYTLLVDFFCLWFLVVVWCIVRFSGQFGCLQVCGVYGVLELFVFLFESFAWSCLTNSQVWFVHCGKFEPEMTWNEVYLSDD